MAAYLGVVVVLTVPGVLIAYLLRMHLGELQTWAAVPLFSLASVFALGELTALIGAPFGALSFAFLIVALFGAAFAKRVRSGASIRADLLDRSSEPSERRDERIAYGLLGLGVLVGTVTWWRGLRGVPFVLPGADGTRHGFMVGRILQGQSIDASSVLVSDTGGAHQVADYFPLGGHASAAIVKGLVPADAGQVLVALTVVFAAIVFPLGMFVLARFLVPVWPLVAGFTAVAVPTLTLFPYSVISDGKAFAIVGMAMVPAAVVLLARAVLTPDFPHGSPTSAVLAHLPAALALLAVVCAHSSELPLVVFLVLLLVLERAWGERRFRLLFRALVHSLIVALLGLVLFAPTLRAFLAAGSERSSLRAVALVSDTDWTELLGPVLTLRTYLPPEGFAGVLPGLPSIRQVLLASLAVVGAAIWLRYRGSAWVVGWLTVIAFSLFASTTDNRLVRDLTFPWYSGSIRINWNQAFFVSLFAAVPLALAVPALARLLRRRSAMAPASLVVVALFAVLVGLPAFRTSASFLRSSFAVKPATFGNQARVDGSSEAAFRWLDVHSDRADTVVNEPNVDGSLWMYTQRGVKPLLGLRLLDSFQYESVSRDWNDRRYVVRHIHELGQDARVEQLVRDYQARWIYFDERTFPVARHELKIDEIRGNPRIHEVFHRNTVHVFKINAA
jgi:Family of unknown function (DUF6541)